MKERLFNVGKIVNTHGIRGEVKVIARTDFPETRFQKGSRLVVQHPEETGRAVDVCVESARTHKQFYLVKFQGMDNINEVERFKGWMLKVREADLEELENGEYYYHEIIGCDVVTEDGERLGTITEIMQPGANDVWVVQPEKGKPILLPYIEQVVKKVDVERKQVTVHLLEGLL